MMLAKEFLQQRAVDLMVRGRYSMANRYDPQGRPCEFICRVTRMNPFRMLVSAPVPGKVGERVVAHFDAFGKLEGWITDLTDGGFLLDLETDPPMRERLARQLTWLEKQQRHDVADLRADGRVVPEDPHSTLLFADGTYRVCFIINMSASGAAVLADVQPPVATPIAIGACVGRVVRHFAGGFAVKFIEKQDPARLQRLITRPVARVANSKGTGAGPYAR